MVCANDKYTYSNIHVLFISLPYYFYKINIFPNVIILDPSTTFQTYDFINKIKENKENKNKIKIKY